jgi:hypothetical protein
VELPAVLDHVSGIASFSVANKLPGVLVPATQQRVYAAAMPRALGARQDFLDLALWSLLTRLRPHLMSIFTLPRISGSYCTATRPRPGQKVDRDAEEG